jgi:hypothetical protein
MSTGASGSYKATTRHFHHLFSVRYSISLQETLRLEGVAGTLEYDGFCPWSTKKLAWRRLRKSALSLTNGGMLYIRRSYRKAEEE